MRICIVDECNQVHKGRGYCQLHLGRVQRNGYPELLRTRFHGLSDTPEYRAWCHMKDRCYNSNSASYGFYGGRGIRVCDRWLQSFQNFYADMGPSNGLSIDRINNDGNYEPSNCRWATRIQQVLNRGSNRNNTSGYRGVSWDKRRKRWYSQMTVDYKHVFIGYFDSAKRASLAYEKLNKERGFHDGKA